MLVSASEAAPEIVAAESDLSVEVEPDQIRSAGRVVELIWNLMIGHDRRHVA